MPLQLGLLLDLSFTQAYIYTEWEFPSWGDIYNKIRPRLCHRSPNFKAPNLKHIKSNKSAENCCHALTSWGLCISAGVCIFPFDIYFSW
jgi:hypothetical protein